MAALKFKLGQVAHTAKGGKGKVVGIYITKGKVECDLDTGGKRPARHNQTTLVTGAQAKAAAAKAKPKAPAKPKPKPKAKAKKAAPKKAAPKKKK